jgi:hypothetical protein
MASKPTVIKALRRFLLDFLDTHPALSPAQYRAIWAVAVCRTSALGGHLHACSDCDQQHYAYHSCNHKACPQCGRQATAQWVDQQQTKLIAAPYFMVTFTLPDELRPLFFGKQAKEAFDAFFAACSSALSEKLGVQKGLGAQRSGFTLVLHTWNQQLLFHPHIHAIDSVASSGSFTLPLRSRAARSSQSVSRLPPPLGCPRRWIDCKGRFCASQKA